MYNLIRRLDTTVYNFGQPLGKLNKLMIVKGNIDITRQYQFINPIDTAKVYNDH